jgi:hypothetical protein
LRDTTYPGRAIKVMATLGGSLDGTNDPRDIASARAACLDAVAKQIAEKVNEYLQKQ